jgi:hypothetical protein
MVQMRKFGLPQRGKEAELAEIERILANWRAMGRKRNGKL